ncbi:unnamed protein product, partial [Strongylus vulgaris]
TPVDPQETSLETTSVNVAKKIGKRHCEFCSRVIPLSNNYSENISRFLHVLHMHLHSEPAVTWLRSRYHFANVREFPYIDIVGSADTSRKNGKSSLHCAICNFKTDSSRAIIHHAKLHEELMRDEGNYPDPCRVCGQQIPVCSKMKESFQRICHVLALHWRDENYVQEATDAYKHEHEDDVVILNVERSLALSFDGRVWFTKKGEKSEGNHP